MTSRTKSKILGAMFSAVIMTGIQAEQLRDRDFGYYVDIPEGFALVSASSDGKSYLFSHQEIPVSIVLKAEETKGKSADKILRGSLAKLSAEEETATFVWNGIGCAISSFSMTLEREFKGWGLCAPAEAGHSVIMLAYSPSEDWDSYWHIIMSALNSLSTGPKNINSPGMIAQYAFPPEGRKNLALDINGTAVETSIDAGDTEAAEFVAEMEFSVLKLYSSHKLKEQAWKRYYRMIFRDSCGRLGRASEDITKALYPAALRKNAASPETEILRELLSWVQELGYRRDNMTEYSTDFTVLPAVLEGTGNDCDSRSMMLCVLMSRTGTESILLVSPEFRHAMAAFRLDAPGQKFTADGKEYLMTETTDKLNPGTINADYADRKKWFAVSFD